MPQDPTNDKDLPKAAPDIKFLIAHLADKDNDLWAALNRLAQPEDYEDVIYTLIYEGALTIETNALTHLFVVDIPDNKYLELVSLTPSVKTIAADKIEFRLKRRLYQYSDSDTTNEKWESVCDEKNIFISKGRRTGNRNTFVVEKLYNGDQLQVDIVSTGSASNLQMAIRAKMRDL